MAETGSGRFAGPAAGEVWTIGGLARAVRELLEGEFGTVWVRGEVSNLRRHGSGHVYFTLKDEKAQLAAVLFRGAAGHAPADLRDGMAVLAFGEITVYEAQGKYQLVVRRIVPHGEGTLQARFEALKRKLSAEGLFDATRKRPLPTFPETVAVVTAPGGAAVRDILNVLGRRAPQVRVRILPVRVQGDAAAGEIAAALDAIRRWHGTGAFQPAVVIVARGGGSIEDLWSFNEEVVARALAACPVPTVSGVGHEVDFTIADFVADVRAPTPSAAAELVIADREELLAGAVERWSRLRRACASALGRLRLMLDRLGRSPAFREPVRVVRMLEQRMDELSDRVGRAAGQAMAAKRRGLDVGAAHLARHWPGRAIRLLESRLRGFSGRLELLNPSRTLARGFAVLQDGGGRVLRSVASVRPGESFFARLSDGRVRATAEVVEPLDEGSPWNPAGDRGAAGG